MLHARPFLAFICWCSWLLGVVQGEWRPVEGINRGPRLHGGSSSAGPSSRCNLYKAIMQQDNYYQYIQYKTHIPDMKEFTLCHWHKFYNHSIDHPIFSYALRDQPKEVAAWVSNDAKASYYQLAIGGHTIYRINYPVRLHKWYHACQSWSSRNGEWQLWIDSERVARGFYNLLVGKTIKGGGLGITGQTQTKYGGGFGLETNGGGRESNGLNGEVTLLQMYKAALTAGKAYNTHKHHHAHKFTHEDKQELEELQELMSVTPGPTPLPEGATEHPFLRGMQLVPRLPVEELNVIRQQQQLQEMDLQQALQQIPLLDYPYSATSIRLFKRESRNSTTEKTQKKRTVLDFGTYPGIDLSGLYTGEGFALGSGVIGDFLTGGEIGAEEEAPVPKKWSEPAEWEVMAIMRLCSGCGEDPFRKATVLSWRETSKKLYAGALYVPAAQLCHHF